MRTGAHLRRSTLTQTRETCAPPPACPRAQICSPRPCFANPRSETLGGQLVNRADVDLQEVVGDDVSRLGIRRDDAEARLEQRRVELPNTEEIAQYAAEFRAFLKEGTIPEKKVLIRNFVEDIEVEGDEATLTYTVPMPSDGAMSESASVLDFVNSGPPPLTVDTAIFEMRLGSLSAHRGLAIPVV